MGRRLGQCREHVRDSGNVCTCRVGSCRVEGGCWTKPPSLSGKILTRLAISGILRSSSCAQPHPGQTLSLSAIIPFCHPFPWRAALS